MSNVCKNKRISKKISGALAKESEIQTSTRSALDEEDRSILLL